MVSAALEPLSSTKPLIVKTDTSLQTTSSQISYPPAQTSSNSEAISRLRSTSSAFPPNLDLRTSIQYRSLPAQQTSPLRMPHTARASSFATAFTSGFQSAPLTAPVDFHLPRTPANVPPEFEAPQMSAPMAPPPDFSPRDTPHQASRNDSAFQQQMHPGSHQAGEQHQVHSAGFLRPEEYGTEEKRKRSYTMPRYEHP